MAQRGTLNTASLVIEIILFALSGVLLAGGLAVMALTSPHEDATPLIAAGMMILLAEGMTSGAGAIHYHRLHINGRARLEEQNAQLQEEIEGLKYDFQLMMIMLTARNDATADELSERRANHHHN